MSKCRLPALLRRFPCCPCCRAGGPGRRPAPPARSKLRESRFIQENDIWSSVRGKRGREETREARSEQGSDVGRRRQPAGRRGAILPAGRSCLLDPRRSASEHEGFSLSLRRTSDTLPRLRRARDRLARDGEPDWERRARGPGAARRVQSRGSAAGRPQVSSLDGLRCPRERHARPRPKLS